MRSGPLFFRPRFQYARATAPYVPLIPRFPYLPHAALMNRLKNIGYKNEGGVCFGLACKAMNDFLSSSRELFNENLRKLATDIPSTPSVTESVRPFLTDVAIGQNPFSHSERHFPIQEPELVFQLIQNDHIAAQGGIQCYDKFCHAYSIPLLTEYFSILRNNAQNCSFALLLSSIKHSIMIGFDHDQNTWTFVDANAMPARRYSTVMQLARAVGNAFRTPFGHMVAFETQVFGTARFDDQLKSFVSRYKANDGWKTLHNDIEKNFVPLVLPRNNCLIFENVFRSHQRINSARHSIWRSINHCLVIASTMGDEEKVGVLLRQNADVNFDNGFPLERAVLHGHLKVVCLLFEAGANVFAIPDKILSLAVFANYYDIAAVLMAYGLDPTKGDPSALMVAQQMKRNDFIELFEKKVAPRAGLDTCDQVINYLGNAE